MTLVYRNILALLVVLATWNAFARETDQQSQTYFLFQSADHSDNDYHYSSEQVSDYDHILKNLKEGDSLAFSNGKTVKLGKRINFGNTTAIYEIADDPTSVIRIPLRSGNFSPNLHVSKKMQYYINAYVEASKTLDASGIRKVKIKDSFPGEYVIVNHFTEHSWSIEDMVLNPLVSAEEREEMKAALKVFARGTAPFSRIGDFHHRQVRYDRTNKEWVLLDWGMGNIKIDPNLGSKNVDNVFDSKIFWLPEWLLKEERLGPAREASIYRYTPSPDDPAFAWIREQDWMKIDSRTGAYRYIPNPNHPELQWLADLANEINDVVHDQMELGILNLARIPVERRRSWKMSGASPVKRCVYDSYVRSLEATEKLPYLLNK